MVKNENQRSEQQAHLKTLLSACKQAENAMKMNQAVQLRDEGLILQNEGKLQEAINALQVLLLSRLARSRIIFYFLPQQQAVRLYPAEAENHNALAVSCWTCSCCTLLKEFLFQVACWKGGYLDRAAHHSKTATKLK
eukprot:747637-Hanusia_phi.AAC.3